MYWNSLSNSILKNKIYLVERGLNHLSVVAFLEESIKDTICYFYRMQKIDFHQLVLNKDAYNIIGSIIQKRESAVLSLHKVEVLSKLVGIDCPQTIKKTYGIRNKIAHTNDVNNDNDSFYDFFSWINDFINNFYSKITIDE